MRHQRPLTMIAINGIENQPGTDDTEHYAHQPPPRPQGFTPCKTEQSQHAERPFLPPGVQALLV